LGAPILPSHILLRPRGNLWDIPLNKNLIWNLVDFFVLSFVYFPRLNE
jgi:hypothetical protein